MLRAREVYEKSRDQIEINNKKILEEIEEAIENAAKAGNFYIYFRPNGGLSYDNEVIEILRSRGFRVNIIDAEMDDYGYLYPQYLEIDWYYKKEKANWITRLKALLHIF